MLLLPGGNDVVLVSAAIGAHNLNPTSYPTYYLCLLCSKLIAIAPKKGTPTLSQPLREDQLFLCIDRSQWTYSMKFLLKILQVTTELHSIIRSGLKEQSESNALFIHLQCLPTGSTP